MRPLENNLHLTQQLRICVTSGLRNEPNHYNFLLKLIKDFGCGWYVLNLSKKGCVVKIRTKDKLFFLGKGKTLQIALDHLLSSLINHYN